jgi:TRAP-type C4-dicarboxylate transport system substrate-binding protein
MTSQLMNAHIISRRTTRRFLAGFALTALAVAGSVGCSASKAAPTHQYIIQFAGINPVSSTVSQAQTRFAQLVEQKSHGMIKVKNTYDSALGTTSQILQEVSTGSLQMSATSPSDLSSFCPSLNMLSLPFLFNSLADARSAMHGPGGNQLFTKCSNGSMQYFPVEEDGMDAFYGDSPLTSISAFKNLKIRTIPGDIAAKALSVVGAEPVSLSFSEVPTALTTNEINATVNSIQDGYSAGLEKLAKYVTVSSFLYSPCVVVINSRFFHSLPSDLRSDIESALATAGAGQIAASGPATNADLNKMSAAGAHVIQLPASVVQAWRAAASGLYASVGDQYGSQILAALRSS